MSWRPQRPHLAHLVQLARPVHSGGMSNACAAHLPAPAAHPPRPLRTPRACEALRDGTHVSTLLIWPHVPPLPRAPFGTSSPTPDTPPHTPPPRIHRPIRSERRVSGRTCPSNLQPPNRGRMWRSAHAAMAGADELQWWGSCVCRVSMAGNARISMARDVRTSATEGAAIGDNACGTRSQRRWEGSAREVEKNMRRCVEVAGRIAPHPWPLKLRTQKTSQAHIALRINPRPHTVRLPSRMGAVQKDPPGSRAPRRLPTKSNGAADVLRLARD